MEFTRTYAEELDSQHPYLSFRHQFHLPEWRQGVPYVYLCGNSLGLQPKTTQQAVQQELDDWATLGVEGHFHARKPWMPYHKNTIASLARLTGARPSEVVAMNSLSVNLHLLLTSFYQPAGRRTKIALEAHAFPSDRYAAASHIHARGLDPQINVIQPVADSRGYVSREEIRRFFDQHGDTIAVVLWGGVNYYTGQVYDLAYITQLAHAHGAVAGFDLAHAIGNVPLQLHEAGVDFAAWCGYKYLNAGPGAGAGIFVHERHSNRPELPRLAGWWSHEESTRFQMNPQLTLATGAEGWQVSNPPILPLACLDSALAIFDQVDLGLHRRLALQLTAFALVGLKQLEAERLEVLTPEAEDERGCQLSLRIHGATRQLVQDLYQDGIICDWREPDTVRVAFVPLYNSFNDVVAFVNTLHRRLAFG
jgi:kynureninase